MEGDSWPAKLEQNRLQVKLRSQIVNCSSLLGVFDSDRRQNKCNSKSTLLLVVVPATSDLRVLRDAGTTGAGVLWRAVGVDGLGAIGGRRRDCNDGLGGFGWAQYIDSAGHCQEK